MADPIVVSAPISGTDDTLTFETGKLAFQSQGSVARHASARPRCWSPPTVPAASARASTSSP